jgi:SAM-dependent methyltransferase
VTDSASRWAAAQPTSADRAEDYAARFADLAATGKDVHGEASLCATLAPPGARVLDAGCGTGRVAVRLAALGYRCLGVDNDGAMLAVARAASTEVEWRLLDLVDAAAIDETFDLVVAAGNVIPLVAPGSEADVIAALAGRLRPGGRIVAGFGLDAAHLPLTEAPFGLVEYDAWCQAAGLKLAARYGTWAADPFDTTSGYAVSVHQQAG